MSRNSLNQYISRLMAVLLVLTLLACLTFPVYADGEGGRCGDDLSWSLAGGTLTITGSGKMWDYHEPDMAPWYPLREEITKLVLPEGLTGIGRLAFYDCYRLTTVDLPESVISIGEYAFASSEKITLLDLGSSLETIGTGAFHGCRGLVSVRLPDSLTSISKEAFYDCRSLTSITIPEKVGYLGSAAFAYCLSMVRAEIRSPLTVLPDWTFFGCTMLDTIILPETVNSLGNAALRNCENLHQVSYDGDALTKEELANSIKADVPEFEGTGYVSNDRPGSTTVAGSAVDNGNGTVTEQSTIVTGGENASVSTSIQHTHSDTTVSGGTFSSDITVTVENDDGWNEAIDGVMESLGSVQDRLQVGSVTNKTQVTVHVKDSDKVDQNFVNTFAGQDMLITVVTKDGSSWKIDCEELNGDTLSGEYDLRYSVHTATEDQCEKMGTVQGFVLRFQSNAEVNSEVLIQLTDDVVRQRATLFQAKKGSRTLIRHQAVLVDGDGFAHFYLGSVTNETDYFIGINVPGEEPDDVIIPDTLYPQYGGAEPIRTLDYVITGNKSSWGMNIGQVTWILAGVMLGSIAIIGFVMYTVNKRKLKAGYIPDTAEEG